MLHSLEDGKETINVTFTKKEVTAYCNLFNLKINASEVPILYLANIWPKFELYQPFITKQLILKETVIEQFEKIQVNQCYNITLTNIASKNIKNFKKHTMKLAINEKNHKIATIKQTFIETSDLNAF